MMGKKVFIWLAHPRADSLCGAMADAYGRGAEGAGAEIRRINLGEMDFAPAFTGYDDPYAKEQAALEPDLRAWQEAIAWADHVVVVHPYWWGGMPAMAKAVIDRALQPGFGYKYRRRSVMWDKLLTGRTGDVIITSDTPPWLDALLYRKPGRRVMVNQILGFCGIKVKHALQVGTVKTASERKIAGWIKKAERLGAKAA
jgi:putative NADPH-quinone reductase